MSNQTMFDFLTQEENLKTALEIAEQVSYLKIEMHKRFWTLIGSVISNRLAASEYSNTWKYIPHSARASRKEWAKSQLIPKSNKDRPYLQIRLGQSTVDSGYRLFWGVQWSTVPKSFNHTNLIDLRSDLISKGLTNAESGWIGWGYLDYIIYEAVFLKRLYTQPSQLIEEISDKFWDLFMGISKSVEKINSEVGSNT